MQISALPDMSLMQSMRQRMFQQADGDGDGALTLDEFKAIGKNAPAGAAKPAGRASADEMFVKLDKDGDGALSAAEMEPPRPQLSSANMSLLFQVQSDNQDDRQASNSEVETADASNSSASFDKLSQLLKALVKSVEHAASTSEAASAVV